MNFGNNNGHVPAGPCAVCKHLAKDFCDATCNLGPYFPLHRTEDFQCVHKVFGIPNLTNILSSVKENERATTVETLILEARMRLRDRVHGSLQVEKKLQAEVKTVEKELEAVNRQLRFFRGEGEPSCPTNSDLKGKKKM
ncbi:hypothetical protein C2S52_010191 [Perilla frutescens var. hirtella]|uniref:LOB domain-containing protein n=1 Tax=Perilla frutescens var. hirtella TaxID=608512 RepID=A0AAD4NX70_PERFH|nr:hypothetical protein C2S53_010035 [Perilla frutescens var. hirtella]KAH6778954.1 hypothetical protein C2S52_010191 [Perilla frutescens var. hirtella]KAH6817031.1 hypothetical protein C2S51_000634 [Perilla frutescens var. frutescens]